MKNTIKQKKLALNSSKGFTIIEVLVSTFVFSLIAILISGLFIQILAIQRRAFALQKIQENALFVTELLSREIRVSKIENQDSLNCTATTLNIIHPINGPVTYSLVNGALQRTAGGATSDLNSSTITFSQLNFCITGSGIGDGQQARVAIIAAIQNKTGKEILTANIQTTITSRDVQNEF